MEKIKSFGEFDLFERELPDEQGKILVILGPPGSGKGTLSKGLESRYGFIHISTGEMIRNSDDKEIKQIVDEGNFLPDDMVIKMLRKELKKLDPTKNVIIDGFPRTMKQAKRLDVMLGRMGLGLNHCIFLVLPDDMAKDRIRNRAKEENREDDKDDKIIEKRFKDYYEKTHPILDFYDKSRKLIRFKATRGKEELLKRVGVKIGLKAKK
jgi:adenylate kinase